jgi:DHA1 family tetracycline resistance protein-like MFS transporter
MVSASAATRKAAVVFILVTVVLDMLALGMIIPVLPLLIEEFRGGDTARAAETVGVFGATFAAVQIVMSPILGSLSDRLGRRPVILLSNFGLGFDYLLMALAPSLTWLFIGRVLAGATAASVPTAYAYIADVTPAEKRAAAFGLMGAAFGIGFILGPAIGGMLGTFGPRTPFWVASAFSCANALYGFFVLPESLRDDHRAPFSWTRANPLGAVTFLRSRPRLRRFAGLHFLNNLAHQSLQSVFVLYAGYRYGWDSAKVGWTLAAVGACFAIVQGGLVGPVVRWIGERRTMSAALTAGVVGFSVYGWAPSGAQFLLGVPIMAFWSMYGPAAQGLMTRRVKPNEQGLLQGAMTSVQMSTGLVGPVLFTQTFATFIDPVGPVRMPGAPFLLSAALILVALVLAAPVTRPDRAPSESATTSLAE